MKSIFLIFYGRFPSEKAASLFAAKSCESFADAGVKVTLLVPRRIGRGSDDPYAHYGVHKNFKIVYLPAIDLFGVRTLLWLAFETGFATFSLSCLLYLLFKANKGSVIYSNESLPIFLASFYFPHTLYEVHDFPERKLGFYKILFRKVRYILATNTWKIKQLERAFSIPQGKIICERNAVEIKDFDIPMSQEEARKKLGLPTKGNIAVYTGHLYGWKGVDTLALAAKKLPEGTLVVFVGGTDADVKRFREEYGNIKNISILGYRDHSEIPLWQKAADVLVLPNTAKEDISKYYTSPMKLFEYMASKSSIVASNIPSIAELLNKENAVLVSPDDSEALASGITSVLHDRELAQRIALRAMQDVQEYTWEKRAKRILNFMGKTKEPPFLKDNSSKSFFSHSQRHF